MDLFQVYASITSLVVGSIRAAIVCTSSFPPNTIIFIKAEVDWKIRVSLF